MITAIAVALISQLGAILGVLIKLNHRVKNNDAERDRSISMLIANQRQMHHTMNRLESKMEVIQALFSRVYP